MKPTLTVLLIIVLGTSCHIPDLTVGSMNLSINNVNSRTLAPDIIMDAHSFQIHGDGPDGETFNLVTSQEQNLIQDLKTGDWNISIEALNPDGLIIGSGSGAVTVPGGETVAANIVVTPLDGTGALDLTVSWDTADVVNPIVSAKLIPVAGDDIPLTFAETVPGTSNSTITVSTGYYTLILQLLDTDTVVMGAVETVRIAADQTTYGSFDFTEVNGIGGTIDIIIDVDLDNPIEVTLTGTLDTLVMGSSMSVTASAPLETVSIDYTWFINGSLAGNGAALDLGSTLNPGIYRLDVIAQTADGSRSGSVNHTFTVISE